MLGHSGLAKQTTPIPSTGLSGVMPTTKSSAIKSLFGGPASPGCPANTIGVDKSHPQDPSTVQRQKHGAGDLTPHPTSMTSQELCSMDGNPNPVTASVLDTEEAQRITVRLPRSDESRIGDIAAWLAGLDLPVSGSQGSASEWRWVKGKIPVHPVEERWETASVMSDETARRNAFGGFVCKRHPEVRLPPPPPGKQERAVHFAPTAPSSSGEARGFRLRRRGRITNCLEQAMRASIGRWTPFEMEGGDLPGGGTASLAHAWLHGYGHGALPKMVAGEAITGSRDVTVDVRNDEGVKTGETTTVKRKVVSTVWVPFSKRERGDDRVADNKDIRALLVAPELVAELSKRRMFRSVSSVLLGSMRGRAVIWADEHGVSAMDLVRIMPGSITLAMLPMPDEVTSLAALRGTAGRWSNQVLGALEQGRLVSAPSVPAGEYFRWPLSWLLGRHDNRVLAPGVGTLTLPA